MFESPARLHALLASEEPVGVVFRRGPSKSVATYLWDREQDTFTLGQWLKGRIYERRSDLSPDGKYLIYFAMNGHWDEEAKGAWTAISRAPYLKALALYPKGDCWHGGGLWTTDRDYWLNDGFGHAMLHESDEVTRDEIYHPGANYGGECPGVYYPRLIRDGWMPTESMQADERHSRDVFDKSLDDGWTLRKIAHGQLNPPDRKGCYWDEHLLVDPSGTPHACDDWEWAEQDGDRVVWAGGGKLFAARMSAGGLIEERELYNFNDAEFEAIEAPY